MKIKMCLLGWLVPGLLVLTWTIIKLAEHNFRTIDTNSDQLFWEIPAVVCIITPVYLVIFLNLIMTAKVLYYFGHMMHGEDLLELRLARATLVLSFLLGINFTVPFALRLFVSDPCAVEIISFVEDVVSCIQGLFCGDFHYKK